MVAHTAYHYTVASNMESIKAKGLLPKPLAPYHHSVRFWAGNVEVIWLWPNKLSGLEHAGSVVFQAGKGETRVAVYEVLYYKRYLLRAKRERLPLSIVHSGNIGSLKYHSATRAILYTKRIKPDRIKLLHVFDITKSFRWPNAKSKRKRTTTLSHHDRRRSTRRRGRAPG